ncbi:MAG TPA: YbhN family protein [Acidimicrobiales bacterium]|nr:YbhN family protein [Acidimicrobiales bacterium]
MRITLALVVVVAVFVGVLPRVADLSEVRRTVGAMTAVEVGTALAVAGWNLWSYWLVQVSSLPGLRIGQAAVVTQSATSLANTVPAGAAVGIGVVYRMYTSWGFSPSAVTLSLLVSGMWNNLAKVGMPVIALALLALQGGASTALVLASLAGVAVFVVTVAVFALALRNDRLARRVGTSVQGIVSRLRRMVRRAPVTGWAERAAGFRAQTIGLLRKRWLPLTASTVVSHLSLYAVLLVALRHVGVSEAEVSAAEILGAFAFVRLISALPVTPGGLGVVELGLTAALVVAGGDEDAVVAGVLVYRALTYLLPIPLGGLTYLWWRRRRVVQTASTG